MPWDDLNVFLSASDRTEVWLTQVFVVVFITVATNFLLMRIFDVVGRFVEKSSSLWDDALVEAGRLPVRLLVWLVGLTIAVEILDDVAETEVFSYVPEVRRVLFIVIIALFLTRFIRYAEENVVDPGRLDKPMDRTTAKAIAKLLRLSVVITAVLVILQTLGYSIAGILAFGGVGGIAVGFAAKDLLANFFGGLMIYLDKPFSVGDWIQSPDRQIQGTVEDIGWRLTRIRTFDMRPLYIPNSMFASIVVENPSRMLNRRIFENIGVRYSDGHLIRQICADVKAMLESHPEIDHNQAVMVNFTTYAASHLEFMVYAYTVTTQWAHYNDVKQDVLLKIMDIVLGHGAEFAFPTRTLHIAHDHCEHEEELQGEPAR